MSIRARSSGICVGACILLIVTIRSSSAAELPRVAMETAHGRIEMEIFTDRAPITSANFLRYVDEGRFEGASFYRTVQLGNQAGNSVKIEVIQGGLGFEESERSLPAIPHESTDVSGLRHLDGTVSMARNEPGSASSEFFICIGDQPELDFGGRRNPDGQGFAAFGRIMAGMDVVRRIQGQPSEEQMLLRPVAIGNTNRLDSGEAAERDRAGESLDWN